MSLKSQLNRLFSNRHKSNSAGGFTLIELLVVVLIAGGILSGLLYLVVELLSVDQREASRNETQREMQLAMDYIATELREAVYVYNDCFLPQGSRTDPDGEPNNPDDDYCPGLINHLPENLTNGEEGNINIPIIAFWKQQPIPTVLKERCASAAPPATVPCRTASSYALVVYSISTANPDDIWDGRARITRYALTQFQSDGSPTPGYAPPEEGVNVRFDRWPGDRQTGTPQDTSAVLVDFLDDGSGAAFNADDETADLARCPTGYSMTPSQEVLDEIGAPDVRSFYACVDQGQGNTNRDVILYIRGNAQGRPGISGEASFLPTLETRVLSRGVLGKAP